MTAPVTQPVNLLIAALGGEGGGVLADWVVAAAHALALPVQATSIPGVAQRTGATTYYIEMWPQPATDLNGRRPVFSLAPAPGEVDVVAASESVEAGRCLFNGFVTPDRTHLITSTHRVYTTKEKMATGDGRYDDAALLRAAKDRAQSTQITDFGALAQGAGVFINAVLFGAIVASGRLPLSVEACEDAIRATAKSVDANLRGFQLGLNAVTSPVETTTAAGDVDAVIQAGADRLLAYQDAAYADLYRQRLEGFQDAGPDVLTAVARNLAVRMGYDDIIRVAEVKIRNRPAPNKAGKVVHVTQYFKPGWAEVCDLLPPFLAKRLLALGARDPWWGAKQWAMTVRTTTISGFLRLWVLAKLKPLRRWTYRYGIEQNAIDHWLDDVRRGGRIDDEFAVEVANMARLIKGYGKTHQRGLQQVRKIRDEVFIAALNGDIAPQKAAERLRKAMGETLSGIADG